MSDISQLLGLFLATLEVRDEDVMQIVLIKLGDDDTWECYVQTKQLAGAIRPYIRARACEGRVQIVADGPDTSRNDTPS